MGHALLVLTPWEKPLALTRIWMYWEILCTLTTGAELSIILPLREEERLTAELLSSGFEPVVRTVLGNVDVERVSIVSTYVG